MKKKLENKTVLIAGKLSEIAKACALAAIYEGANIVVADIKSDETEKAIAEMKKENSDVMFIPCDVSKFEDVGSAIKRVVEQFGAIDIALNNTGIDCEPGIADDINRNIWLQSVGVNLNGVFNCMSHQLPEMAKQKKGVILNMAYMSGSQSFSESPHYVATKHGLIGLTKTAAIEYKNQGIRINALCPGSVSNPVNEMEEEIFKSGSRQQHTLNIAAIKKMEKIKEIANGFIFMASEKSPFITGTAVEIDGGYLSQ